MLKKVFLSYRQESPEHARAVKRLGELLRQANLPVVLDQFYMDENPGGPDDGGWPKWCEHFATESLCVVVIGSEGWFTAYEDPASVVGGYGSASEARLFRQYLYDEKGINERMRLAFLHEMAPATIPPGLRAWHQFRPFDIDDQLNQLILWVAKRLGIDAVVSPTVRWPSADDSFIPDLANREQHEWPAIKNLISGTSRERIILFQGGTGVGKSLLGQEAIKYAKKLGVQTCRVDLKSCTDVASILGQIYLDLGSLLPNFSDSGGSKSHLLRKDLRALRKPVLLILDSYDQAVEDNKEVADWVGLQLLNEVETSLALAVVITGQNSPDFVHAAWRALARHLSVSPIKELDYWEPWISRKFPKIPAWKDHLPTVLLIAEGNPMVVYSSCEAIAKNSVT
jgi:hypothetical protein